MPGKDDCEFLRRFLQSRQELFEKGLDLSDMELLPPRESSEAANIQKDAERCARLAEACGFDGNLFRDLFPVEENIVQTYLGVYGKQIEMIPRIIAAIETKGKAVTIPDDAKLLTLPQVANLLCMGESTVREKNRKGLIPKASKIGGSLRWNRDEIRKWIEANSVKR